MSKEIHEKAIAQRNTTIRIHEKKEPYECEVCHKKFFHNPNYTEHKKTHPEHSFSKKSEMMVYNLNYSCIKRTLVI